MSVLILYVNHIYVATLITCGGNEELHFIDTWREKEYLMYPTWREKEYL